MKANKRWRSKKHIKKPQTPAVQSGICGLKMRLNTTLFLYHPTIKTEFLTQLWTAGLDHKDNKLFELPNISQTFFNKKPQLLK